MEHNALYKVYLTIGIFGLFCASTVIAQDRPTANLVLTSNIRDCRIIIDSDTTSYVIPALIRNIEVGEYTVKLVDRYGKTLEEQISIEEGRKNNYHLDFFVGDLAVRSNLQVDSLFINGVLTEAVIVDSTQAIFKNMAVGNYTLTLVDRFGITMDHNVYLTGDGLNEVSVEFPIGDLKLNSSPSGAKIFLNGRATGVRTPTMLPNLASGIYNIFLTIDGKKISGSHLVKATPDNDINIRFTKRRTWPYWAGALGTATVTAAYFLTRGDQGVPPDTPGIDNPSWPPGND